MANWRQLLLAISFVAVLLCYAIILSSYLLALDVCPAVCRRKSGSNGSDLASAQGEDPGNNRELHPSVP